MAMMPDPLQSAFRLRPIADASVVSAAIGRIAREVERDFPDPSDLVVVGVTNGGVPFSEVLHARLKESYRQTIAQGIIDVRFHRDDIGTKPIPKVTFPTRIDVPVENATVLLCDDVIQSGRTIRAALNELFDLGRPARVRLAVIADRGPRALPIQPDYTGMEIEVPEAFTVHAALDPASPETWSVFAR